MSGIKTSVWLGAPAPERNGLLRFSGGCLGDFLWLLLGLIIILLASPSSSYNIITLYHGQFAKPFEHFTLEWVVAVVAKNRGLKEAQMTEVPG